VTKTVIDIAALETVLLALLHNLFILLPINGYSMKEYHKEYIATYVIQNNEALL
jgi:hypothetical protein